MTVWRSNMSSEQAGDPADAGSKRRRLNPKLVGYTWWREVLGSPRYICSPMVDQSELAFRRLCLRHGTHLCYTPMINSKSVLLAIDGSGALLEQIMQCERPAATEPFGESKLYQILAQHRGYQQSFYVSSEKSCSEDAASPESHQKHQNNNGLKFLQREFSTCAEERGRVIAQFCGNHPNVVLAAARLVERVVDGIDLNCGCPQGIAKKGGYGSFLLETPDLICDIVSTLAVHLESAPVTVKIRKVSNSDDLAATLLLCERLVACGASALTLHGRTKEEKGQHCREADWDAIKKVKEKISHIPVFANGGIEFLEEAERCLEHTKADAVMSAEALLEDPQLFKKEGSRLPQEEVFEQYLEIARSERGGVRVKTAKAHAFHSLYASLQTFTELRAKVGSAKSLDELQAVVCELKRRRRVWDARVASSHSHANPTECASHASPTECDSEDWIPKVERLKEFPNLGWYRRYRNPIGGKTKSNT